MCVAGLNVSTQACAHRWYDLRKACQPANNLANCTGRLQLEGWENRSATCPWCSDSDSMVHDSTHKLVGQSTSAAASPVLPDTPLTRSKRSGSDGTLDSLSRVSSISSVGVETDWGQRHRDMNDRLEIYLRSQPHDLLPSAKKNYPTYSQSSSSTTSADDGEFAERPVVRRSSSGLSKKWKKSVRFSRGIFGS